jgi:SpoVK/Ycf46/Vps4 family AAA+-type ATPase
MILVQTKTKDNFQILNSVEPVNKLSNGYYIFNRNETGTFLQKTNDLINPEVKVLHSNESDKIYNEIETWITKEQDYKKLNFPFKRGYFFHSPPGLGKTKLIESILIKLNRQKVLVFNIDNSDTLGNYIDLINQFDLNEGILKDYLKVFILEDIEGIIEHRHSETRLLQLLDGNIKIHKCLFFATTNYPDSIPERLLSRPSRFDRKIEIKTPDENVVKQYLESFNIDNILEILPYIKEYTFAQIKEFIISYYLLKLPVEEIKEDLKKYKEESGIGFKSNNNYGIISSNSISKSIY